MNLKQMEAFRAVMLNGSVSQAAKQLFRTQPAVSMMLSSLEEEIGFQLFERHKKRLYPTPEAEYLYKEVEGIFNRIQDVSQTIQDIQNKQYGFLRLGCMPGPSTFFMPELLADFLTDHPKVQASLQTRTSDLVAEWVASNQYDLGLAEITQHQAQLAENDRFSLPCYVAIPADNPLAKHDVITTQLLDGEPMITLHPDHMLFHDLLIQFENKGHRMNVRLQTRFFIPALTFVERGLGVCIMDPVSITSYQGYASPGKIVFRRFFPNVLLKIGIFYPDDKPRSIITQEFSERLRRRLIEIRDNADAYLSWGD